MTASVRESAERELEQLLSPTHPNVAAGLFDYRRGITAAMVELGVLEPQDRDRWDARFERAARPVEPPDERLHRRAIELLEREFAQADGSGSNGGDVLGSRERIRTKVQALLESGIVGWDERAALFERLDAVAPDTSPRLPVPTCHMASLRRVVVGPEVWVDEARVKSVELYDDCAIVRWHLHVGELDSDWPDRLSVSDLVEDLKHAHAPNALADNLGTDYKLEPPTGPIRVDVLHLNQRPAVLPGASLFTPAVPSEAATLTLVCPRGQVRIDLQEAD